MKQIKLRAIDKQIIIKTTIITLIAIATRLMFMYL